MNQSHHNETSSHKLMPVFDHLEELRSRVIKSLIAVLILFVIALYYSTEIIIFLKAPLLKTFPTQGDGNLHFTGPLDVFLTSIKVSFLTSIVLACPYWLYHFWKFMEPALYKKEQKFLLPFLVSSISLFILGTLLCYYIILPLALDFLISMGKEVGIPMITITDYISLLSIMIFGFGIAFESPLILILLSTLDIINSQSLASCRRYVIVGVLVLGALLTPPDPMSQIGLAIPLYLMFEFSLIIIRILEKKKPH